MQTIKEEVRGTIYDVRHFTMGDGPGVRTTVFFKGCPLRCSWCHNPEARSPSPERVGYRFTDADGNAHEGVTTVGKECTTDDLMEMILRERKVMEMSGGGVTFSGGEPLMQEQFLYQLLQRSKAEGLHTALDTNGYADREVLERIVPLTDLFLYDIKHVNREKHLDYTAVSTVQILDNLRYLLERGAAVWLRIPVVPGFNYSRGDMFEVVEVLQGMPPGIEKVQLISYRRTGISKYRTFGMTSVMEDVPSLRPRQLTPFKRMFRRAGFTTEILR